MSFGAVVEFTLQNSKNNEPRGIVVHNPRVFLYFLIEQIPNFHIHKNRACERCNFLQNNNSIFLLD